MEFKQLFQTFAKSVAAVVEPEKVLPRWVQDVNPEDRWYSGLLVALKELLIVSDTSVTVVPIGETSPSSENSAVSSEHPTSHTMF